MKLLKINIYLVLSFCFVFTTNLCLGQQGNIVVNQDQAINRLLALKKDMNLSENDSDRYKIQIYSGNRTGAENAKSKLLQSVEDLNAALKFETPNYKVWAGNFRSRLEADRALLNVKKTFPDAFVFKPKKEKE